MPAARADDTYSDFYRIAAHAPTNPCPKGELSPSGIYPKEAKAGDNFTYPKPAVDPATLNGCPVTHATRQYIDERWDQFELIRYSFAQQGICCSKTSLARGLTCRGKIGPEYSEEVAFFIPAGYQPQKQADVILTLHGWLNQTRTQSGDVLDEFKFQEMMASAGRQQSIMIVPLSTDKNQTHKAHFGQYLPTYWNEKLKKIEPRVQYQGANENQAGTNKFPAFMSRINSILGVTVSSPKQETGDHISGVSLVGHSGAGTPMDAILSDPQCEGKTCYRDKIKSVHMLDATYGYTPHVEKFVTANPHVNFTSTYIRGSGTAGNSEGMQTRFNGPPKLPNASFYPINYEETHSARRDFATHMGMVPKFMTERLKGQ